MVKNLWLSFEKEIKSSTFNTLQSFACIFAVTIFIKFVKASVPHYTSHFNKS